MWESALHLSAQEMMSRKDYELIAAALKQSQPTRSWHPELPKSELQAQWDLDVRTIANALAVDNPRFDFRRFLLACSSEDGQ